MRRLAVLLMVMVAGTGRIASAQVTPAAPSTTPDDTPSLHVGMTLFPNFTYQTNPEITDVDGNVVNRNAFDVTRAYINLTGNISHLIAYRITPDITRQSSLLNLGPGSSVPNDSLVFRIKYAYAQFNLDDWTTAGTWTRIGIQDTPWVAFEESIYRYRFQGTVFAERIPLPTAMTSADAGVSFHYNVPKNYGDFHVGVYNGENYQRVEVNDQKGLELRGTIRPFATNQPVLQGLRAHFVYYNDHYAGSDERKRVMGSVTYEHRYLHTGFDYLSARDQTQATAANISSNGYSIWATPRLPGPNGSSWEALLRYDHWTPNTATTFAPLSTALPGTRLNDQHQNRLIVGGAYWFPHQGNVSTAILVDYDGQHLDNITTAPLRAVSVHGLLQF